MSSVIIEEPSVSTAAASERLRRSMAAARVSFTWFGTNRALSSEQRNQAADSFGAEGRFLAATKKLLDTSDPRFKAVTAIRGRTVAYWKEVSLPFPEPGIRLIRQDTLTEFTGRMEGFCRELVEAVHDLDSHYDELRGAARTRLGALFNPADYPPTLVGLFALGWSFPSVEPPPYLQRLAPDLYQQECRRIREQFSEAVRLAEQAFLQELSQLVNHLAERLSGTEDGRPKVFRDSAVENLHEFFARFRRLNIGSHQQLDQLIGQARQILTGVGPQGLRNSDTMRQHISTQMAAVQAGLDQLLVDRPRRNIQRQPR